ncbi:MAG: BCCT family transporter [Synergistaceae bacterium]|nr:BCCT family transporter [Synergistaceae bacterium]
MTKQNETSQFRFSVMAITGILFIVMLIFIVTNAEDFYYVLNNLVMVNMMDKLGWFVNLVMLFFVAVCIVVLFHPIGKIRLGGPNAKPEFTYMQWFAISLCTGIGAGVVFWGAAEPLLFSMEPAPSFGYAAGSNEAILWSMRTCFLHWGFTPYASCVVMGIILSYFCLNKKAPFKCSSALIPIFGEKVAESKWGAAFDSLSAFALTGAVAGGLGYGMLQLSQGLRIYTGIEPSTMVYATLITFMFLCYNASALSGLKRGISWLSDRNTQLFFILLIFMFLTGPISYTLNLMTETLGEYFGNFIQASTYTAPYVNGGNWPQNWDMYWWVDWLAYAPLLGLFMVRVAHGRTLREFVLVEWVFPALFGIVWFTVFGGIVLHSQFFDSINFYEMYKTHGAEVLTLSVFDTAPFASISKGVMLIIITVSLVTQCDSMVVTLSSLCMKNSTDRTEAPIWLKLFWGIVIAVIALGFTLLGGIDGVKTIKSFCGFPMAFLCLFMTLGFIRYMSKRPRNAMGEYEYEPDALDNMPNSGEPTIPGSLT